MAHLCPTTRHRTHRADRVSWCTLSLHIDGHQVNLVSPCQGEAPDGDPITVEKRPQVCYLFFWGVVAEARPYVIVIWYEGAEVRPFGISGVAERRLRASA